MARHAADGIDAARDAAAAEARADAEQVVLVDEGDRAIGAAEKLSAHRDGGRLHRAFSVFLFDAQGRVLLQRRAVAKYHFPLLWTNACCGHPRPGEGVVEAARRRVREELGVAVTLRPAFAFVYAAEDPATGLVEREWQGRTARIRARPEALHPADDWLARTRRGWEQRLDALEEMLRDEEGVPPPPTKKGRSR